MHVAIIMDGNGRWARLRELPRTAGHAAGARAVHRIVEAASRGPIETLTLYAFSVDNWSRPPDEVRSLMDLLEQYLASESDRCSVNGIRVSVIGRRDRLHGRLQSAINEIESITAGGSRLHLRLAVDYSSRDAIVRTAAEIRSDANRQSFAEQLARSTHVTAGSMDVDLLIRTGGEQRLSDFLLWECAYAEMVFVDTLWPDFDETSLAAAMDEFRRRERRFGGLERREPAHAESVR